MLTPMPVTHTAETAVTVIAEVVAAAATDTEQPPTAVVPTDTAAPMPLPTTAPQSSVPPIGTLLPTALPVQPPVSPASPAPPRLPAVEPAAGDAFSQKPTIATLSSVLDQLRHTDSGQTLDSALTNDLRMESGRVQVNLVTQSTEAAISAGQAIPALGGEVTAQFNVWVDAWVPVAQLEALARLSGVTLVQPVIPVIPTDMAQPSLSAAPRVGAAQTQGVSWSNADVWHAAGYDGAGIQIAVLAAGFDGAAAAQTSGDLPAAILCYTAPPPAATPSAENCAALANGETRGTAAAEIIHDMAPGASLTFAIPPTATQMALYIEGLAQAGYDVIISTVAFPSNVLSADANDGSGPVGVAITQAYQNYGTLYVQAAGDNARLHWEGCSPQPTVT